MNVVGVLGTDRSIHCDKKKEQIHRHVEFLLCKSCLWCVSCIDSQQKHMTRCPSCNDSRLNYLPIADNEIYDLDMRRRSRILTEAVEESET